MIEQIKNHLLYAGVTKEEFESVREDIVRANNITALSFASVAVLLVSSMYIFSFFVDALYAARTIYLCGAISALLIVGLSLIGKKRKSVLCYYLSVYMSISMFLIYGIAISILTPERATVTFMVMMMLLSVIFVDKPIRMGAMIIIHMVFFIVLARITKNNEIFAIDMINTSVYGILSIASSFIIIHVKVKSYVIAKKLKKLSEKDILTGLNNRNCYESRLDGYGSSFNHSIGCVYVDVNGLHELNNTQGHKAGDEMLCCIAEHLQHLFGEIHTYRIGGDEFVAFIIDAKEEYICDVIFKFMEKLSENGYSAAIGYSFKTEPVNIDSFVEHAEKKMYTDKAKYYETHQR